MKKDHILLLALVFVFSSCIESRDIRNENEYMNKISIDKIQGKDLAFSQFCDSVSNIALETTENSLIGNVDKVELFEDRLILLDREMTNSVYIFKIGGEFVGVINNRGKGPEEYLSADDVAVDRKKREVVLLDSDGRKLLFFDFAGNFIKTTKLDFWASNLEYIEEDLFLFNLGSPKRNHNLLIANRNGQHIKEMILFEKETLSDKTEKMISSLTKYKNGININFPLSNEVYFYNVDDEQVEFMHYIDFGDQGISEKELEETQTMEQLRKLFDDGGRVGNEIFLESDRYIYMINVSGGEVKNVFFDKIENKWYEHGFSDDFTGIPLTYAVGMENNVLVSFIFPSWLMQLWDALPEEEKGKAKYDYIRELTKTLEVDDNPIIRLMYLKTYN